MHRCRVPVMSLTVLLRAIQYRTPIPQRAPPVPEPFGPMSKGLFLSGLFRCRVYHYKHCAILSVHLSSFSLTDIRLTTVLDLFDKKDAEPIDRERSDDSSDGYRLMCQANLEAALAGLPLCFKATYDMVLALALGVR